MSISHPLINGLTGMLGSAAVRIWMSALDYKVACYDPTMDPRDPNFAGSKIFVFWHEYMLFPLQVCGHTYSAVLMSNHRDGEIVARMAYHLGFDCVRGSTNRGGARALRELQEKCRTMNLAITPDGPRGPRRTMTAGAIFLASKLQLPLVLLAFGFDRPWRLPTWDRFAIPRFGTRARGISSPPVMIPSDLDRDGIEHHRGQVERLLNRLTLEAEAWAESGTRKVEERPMRRGPSNRPTPRGPNFTDSGQSPLASPLALYPAA